MSSASSSQGARVPLQKDRLASGPRPGLLGRQLRLGQLALAVVALGTLLAGDDGIFTRFLVPAAALQCAWSAAAVIVHADMDVNQRRWTRWAYMALDMVTSLVTYAAASAALGVAFHVAVENCTAYPLRCAVTRSVWPKAVVVVAWAVLQLPAAYIAVVKALLEYAQYATAWDKQRVEMIQCMLQLRTATAVQYSILQRERASCQQQ